MWSHQRGSLRVLGLYTRQLNYPFKKQKMHSLYLNVYLVLRWGGCTQAGQGQREGDRGSKAGCQQSREPYVGLELMNCEIMT